MAIVFGISAAASGDGIEVTQFDAENGCLDGIEAGDHAELEAIIAGRLAMVAEEAGALANRVIIRDEHSAITAGIQVFERMQAETTDFANGADWPTIEFCADGLGGVLNHRNS